MYMYDIVYYVWPSVPHKLAQRLYILCCFCWFLIEYTLHVALCFQAKPLRHQPPGSHFKVLHELISPLSAKLLNLDQMLPSMGVLETSLLVGMLEHIEKLLL